MDLKSTIASAVDTVFVQVASLTKLGLVAGKVTERFDFTTKKLVSDNYSFNVRFIELKNEVLEDGSIQKELLFKEKDLDPSLYSTITYEGQTYRFESVSRFEAAFIVVARSA